MRGDHDGAVAAHELRAGYRLIKRLLLRHYARAAPALDLAAAAYRGAVLSYDAYGAHNAAVQDALQRELSAVLSAPGTLELWAYGKRFEGEFAAFCGRAHGVGTASGTAALQIALVAAGVGPGDEVVTSAHTFVATVLAILNTGARPVLVDPAPGDLCITPEGVLRALSPRTRVVKPVHMHGHVADVEGILAALRAAGREDVRVIEDCAQAHGAARGGTRVPIGGTGCFSFFASKPLGGAGNGGMIVTDDAELARRCDLARDPEGDDALVLAAARTPSYLDALEAAVLRARLPQLPAWRERRAQHAAAYRAALAHLDPVLPAPGVDSAWYSFVVRPPLRDALKRHLLAHRIETKIEYHPGFLRARSLAHLGWRPEDYPVAVRAADEGLSLPVHPFLDEEDRTRVIDAVRSFRG